MQILLRWAISAGALYATVWILQALGLGRFAARSTWYAWFIAVVVMALVNALIRPVARLLTAPMNCMTFGIVGILVNGLMFWLVPTVMKAAGEPVFEVGFLGAVLGAILVGGIGGVANNLIVNRNEED